jgi:hypothetical protein
MSQQLARVLRNALGATSAGACTFLLTLPAEAMDGEVLIDQAKVNAGGITPGDAPGFPATLSRAGRYKLSGNLDVPAEKNGIEVKQNDVAIDLNGFTIGGNPAGEAANGVYSDGRTGLHVMNGTIMGFGDAAISNGDGAFNIVGNMRLVANSVGIAVFGNSRIHDNIIAATDFGISCDDAPCLIEGNIVTGGRVVGILADSATVLGNVIVSNDGIGLLSPSGGYGGNVLVDNGDAGGGASPLHPNFCWPACP